MPHHTLLFISRIISTLLFIFLNINVSATEVIQNYESTIVIETDGSLIVTEKITVNSEGDQIKRGIYRDFPTQYKDIYGNNYNVKFEILSIRRDGVLEDYHTEELSDGIRIYIGNKGIYLMDDSHTYTIEYYTHRQIGFFEQYDELYWNVTGNGWAFPILQASAKIQLPPGVENHQTETTGYTGAMGDKGQNFVVSTPETNTVLFNSTDELPLHHGLTVVVNWPKGYVTEPDLKQKLLWFFSDNRATLVGLIGIAILWIYLVTVWLKVGKDPSQGIIYPRYYPEKNHSPASMRFVQNMDYDDKAFSAALVNMAVKGYLSITMKRKYFTIEKIGGSVKLSLGEAAIARSLFNRKDKIILKQAEHSTISKAISAHKKTLTRDYEKTFFKHNKMALLPGWLGSIVILAITIFSLESSEARALTAFFTVWLSIWSIVVAFLSIGIINALKNVRTFSNLMATLGVLAFATPFIAGEILGLFFFWKTAGAGILLVFILVIITNILFYEWMKAPTLKGRELLDKADGFKHYLMVTQKDELQKKTPSTQIPELTPELFEQYLPYAMALDVEKQWSQRFSSIFAQLEKQGHLYHPRWYKGKHWNTNNISSFSSAMGSTLSSAISSSSTAPGSSSGSSSGGGFSSGGSSGGGSGGGGGGGW